MGIRDFTERLETGPPKSFASSVAARAPELRRPRFSFLYNRLVKEPDSRDDPFIGGDQAPRFIQQLRPTDQTDQ